MAIFLVFAVVGGIAAAALLHFGRKELKRRALIRETPTTWAREVSSGYVEVKGTVEPGEVTMSPFQQVPSVMVRWKVEEYRRRGKSSTWVTVLSGTDAHDFWIRDDTGRVRIPIGQLQPVLYLSGSNTTSSGTFRSAPEHVEQFLARHGRSSSGWVFNKSMRYTEECIQPGEHLYALGHARRDGTGEAYFAPDPGGAELILANLTEEELERRMGSRGTWMVGGGSLLGIGAVVMIAMAAASAFR